SLARPLVSETTIDSEPDRDLSREVCSTRPEVIVKVEVRLAEHERGLELQISFPESTLATMLPITNVIEAASVLMRELFFTINKSKCSTKTPSIVPSGSDKIHSCTDGRFG